MCLHIVGPILFDIDSEQLLLRLQVWQHCDCMRLETEVEHYLCELCDPRPIDRVGVAPARVKFHIAPCSSLTCACCSTVCPQEVPMKPQPSYAQAGSIYYICLLRDELLLHQGQE